MTDVRRIVMDMVKASARYDDEPCTASNKESAALSELEALCDELKREIASLLECQP